MGQEYGTRARGIVGSGKEDLNICLNASGWLRDGERLTMQDSGITAEIVWGRSCVLNLSARKLL